MPYGRHATRAVCFAGAVLAATTGASATAPGQRVLNTVTVTFAVDSVAQDAGTAEVGFVVDRKIDMLVADTGSIVNGRPKQEGRELIYKVTNEGNDAQPFDIDVTLTGTLAADLTLDTNTDTLGPGEYRVHISPDTTTASGTVYDPTGFSTADTPLAYDAGATTDEFYVIIVVNIPSDAQDDEAVRFSVRATALDGGETAALTEVTGRGLDNAATPADAVDIVFADGTKTTDSEGTDVAEDGRHTDNASLTVASAELTVTKEVTILSENTQGDFVCATGVDPGIDDNTQGAIPGACLEYKITVANGAAASEHAQNVAISDTLPAGVSFVAFRVDGTSSSTWSDADHDAGVVTASLDADLEDGDEAYLVFRVLVD